MRIWHNVALARSKQWERERDIARGYWEVSPPLTADEEEEMQQLKINYELYEEVQKTERDGSTWREWRLRDPDVRERLEALETKKGNTLRASTGNKQDYPRYSTMLFGTTPPETV